MKRVAYIGIFSTLAVVLGYLEAMIPMPVPIPGVKFGFSNIAVVTALYVLGKKEAMGISLIKAFCCGMLFWGAQGVVYAVFGSAFSISAMLLTKRTKAFSVISVSVIGAVFHNIGQLTALRIFSGSFSFVYYLGILGIAAVVTGTITGGISRIIIDRLNNFIKS